MKKTILFSFSETKMSTTAPFLRLSLNHFFPLESFQVTKIGHINTYETLFLIIYLILLEEK